jgi:uncharacterized membrane protein
MHVKRLALATAVAFLFFNDAAAVRAESSAGSAQVRCFGINSCKGQSFCATAKNACAGQNTCKAKGWLMVTRQECSSRGGQELTDKDK